MIHISLFSGIGGFELAAEWMGWRNLVSCDINEFGNKVREYYWPDGYCHRDVKTLTYETIDRELSARFGTGWRDDDIILTGGFPCQPYSAAGKRLGKDDERHLWPEMLRVISEVKPTYIVGENVRGLTNWNGGVVFEEVCADLEAHGYEVQPVLLPACAVGSAPHRRDRIWFVAYATSNGYDAESTTTNNGIRKDNQQSRTQRKRTIKGLSNERPTPDTDSLRHRGRGEQSITDQSEEWAMDSNEERNGDGIRSQIEGCCWPTPDTESQRSRQQQSEDRGWENRRPDNDGEVRDASDTESKGRKGADWVQTTIGLKYGAWNKWPTTEPTIRSGNDGLSSRLDGITFSKHRNESIKAYGNAVVPQVVYQIFKAIHDTH